MTFKKAMIIGPLAVIISMELGNRAFGLPVNGYRDGSQDMVDPPIEVGVDWTDSADSPPSFQWNRGVSPAWLNSGEMPQDLLSLLTVGHIYNLEGPFSYKSAVPTQVFITDDFLPGDAFEIYDFNKDLSTLTRLRNSLDNRFQTTIPEPDPSYPLLPEGEGPGEAFHLPVFSRGLFQVEPGDHLIIIRVLDSSQPVGRGYIKVEALPDSGSTYILMVVACLGMLGLRGSGVVSGGS